MLLLLYTSEKHSIIIGFQEGGMLQGFASEQSCQKLYIFRFLFSSNASF
jgi:hypothetical protein